MSYRKRSIKILQDAVKNKTLGCYNDSVKDEGACLYYHGESETCCAVGAIIPRDKLLGKLDGSGNVNCFYTNGEANKVTTQLDAKGTRSLYGIKYEELEMLQELHDVVVQGRGKFERLEQYIGELK